MRKRRLWSFELYWSYTNCNFIVISTITGCFSIFAFASLVVVPIESTSSAMRLKICVVTAGIKRYKSIIKKKKKNIDKIVLLSLNFWGFKWFKY